MSDESERTATSRHAQELSWPPMAVGAAIAGCSEWLSFVHDRLQKDLALAHRLSLCRDPSDVSRACVAFWSEAARDYQDGAIRIGRMQLAAWSAAQDGQAPRETRQGPGKERLSRAA